MVFCAVAKTYYGIRESQNARLYSRTMWSIICLLVESVGKEELICLRQIRLMCAETS